MFIAVYHGVFIESTGKKGIKKLVIIITRIYFVQSSKRLRSFILLDEVKKTSPSPNGSTVRLYLILLGAIWVQISWDIR